MSVIPAHENMKQENYCKFKAILGYMVNSKLAGARVKSLNKKTNKKRKALPGFLVGHWVIFPF